MGGFDALSGGRRDGSAWRPDAASGAIVLVWTVVYAFRALAGHLALETNAFDLSIFDYALWSLGQGGHGQVPFLGHSIFSHHFMPILGLLAPAYAAAGTPGVLLIVQVIATAAAALLFAVVQRRAGVDRRIALVLTAVFLLSRTTHGAVAGSFYPECFQALLTFAIVLAWTHTSRWYWALAVLFLSVKEDSAIYLASFSAVMLFADGDRRKRALVSGLVAVVWFVVALWVAIPTSRVADGLPPSNPLLAGRFASAEGRIDTGLLVDRVASTRAARHVANLLASSGGLSLAAPLWLAPALPGILINLAADPESMQASLTGHYAWPILPWMFVAAAFGSIWLTRRFRRASLIWIGVLLVAVVADNPAVQRLHRTSVPDAARLVRQQLASIDAAAAPTVLAQPNLIPHLAHHTAVFTPGGIGAAPPARPALVLLTEVGNLWPLDRAGVAAEVRRFRADADYELLSDGPLFAFRLRPAALAQVRMAPETRAKKNAALNRLVRDPDRVDNK